MTLKIDKEKRCAKNDRHFVPGVIAQLARYTAKEQDYLHFYEVFADYVRKHLEKI